MYFKASTLIKSKLSNWNTRIIMLYNSMLKIWIYGHFFRDFNLCLIKDTNYIKSIKSFRDRQQKMAYYENILSYSAFFK